MSRRRSLALLCTALCIAYAPLASSAPKLGQWGVDLTSLDKTIKPGDNFFLYVNGGWLKTAEIPAARASTGSFQDLQILSEERLKTIVADLEKKRGRLTVEERKLRDLYDSFVDTDAIEARGLAAVQKDLDYLGGLQTLDDVARAMGSVKLSTFSVYNIGIGIDDKLPDNYSVNLGQGGLGMPDRDYYLSNDAAIVKTREAYRKYLADMMTLGGMNDAAARADRVRALETEIAKVSWTRADRRDADKIYNPMPASALKTLAPDFAWDAFLSEGAIPLKKPDGNERYVIVAEKTAFGPLGTIFKNTPVSTWRDYLIVHYLHTFAAYLPKRFDDLDFSFYGTALSGRTAQLDRQTRAVHLLDRQMGEALGKLYVARYFPPDAKSKADLLVSNLLKAYEADIRTLDWMSPATRAKALEKLHQFTPKIGYPSKWRDYSALQVVRGDPVGNAQRATMFEWNRDVARINKPVDKSEWGMTPSTINAYYNPSFNEIVFPAAILQAPFFDPDADDAVNYGAIGAVIGHEISHGFDDQGSKYDGKGVFQDWWTKEDRANFDARTAILVKQYDAYEPLPGLHVIGQNTLGENIADTAGLAIALKAYRLSLNGKPAPVIDGYTGDQRLLLSFGQVWRTKMRENAIRTQTMSNEHTVAEFRVIGPTRNMDGWYEAFDVKPGEKYYLPPAERVRIW
jgi:putative endopeptidase